MTYCSDIKARVLRWVADYCFACTVQWLDFTYSDPDGMILHDVVYQRVIELEYYERTIIMYQVAEGMKYLDERNVIISWRQIEWHKEGLCNTDGWLGSLLWSGLFCAIITNLIGLMTQ